MNGKGSVTGGVFLFLLLMIILSAGFQEEDLRYKKIKESLRNFTQAFHQQKVYLHLDKNVYHSGDNIWIKAYLLNGIDHLPDTVCTNLYVELISPNKTRVQMKRFQMFKGFGIGDFALSDTLQEGLYQIRAFTSWMQNFDTEFYFEKNFQLINKDYKKLISPRQARINKKELKDQDEREIEIDLQFLPEGGYLVNGIESTVAFRAINKLARGIEISGSIFDEKGAEIVPFHSYYKGIGTFRITPQKGNRYYAVVKSGNKSTRVYLPEALETGLVMHVEESAENLKLVLTANRLTADPSANEYIVVGQTGGVIYFSRNLQLQDGTTFQTIPKKLFPSGIMQLTVFSSRGNPVAERLVFINRRSSLRIHMSASDSSTEEGKKKTVVTIDVRDAQNVPVIANLSMSVTRQMAEESAYNRDNISSNLLICSDLKGFVEDPADYLKLSGDQYSIAIDNLMMTHGWRRFNWNSILAGEYPEIKYAEEKGITISGKITRDFFNIPLNNCKVQLSIMDQYNDIFTQRSSEKGTFMFNNLVYYDTVHIKIEAWRPSGRKNLLILLPEQKENEVTAHEGEYLLTVTSERDKKAHRLELYNDNKELMQKEKEALEERKKNSVEALYGEPDFVLYSEDFHMISGNALDVLKGRVPGVVITGNQVVIRGVNTIMGSSQPLFLVDGMQVLDVGAVTSIPIEDIDRIEVLKGPRTAVYGAQGANGVIAVFTKRGQFMIRGRIEFEMLGYSTPRQFYEQKFEPGLEPDRNYTIYWSPVIITNSMGKARIVFDKPAASGNFRFDIQGISYEGHTGYMEELVSNQ